jgi:predicted CoA-binding protein
MMKVTKELIDNFFKDKRIAIAGVSRNPKKFGYLVFKELKTKGFNVLPVNPNTDVLDGIKCYHKIEELPADTESLLILTPKSKTDEILRTAIDKGIKNIWVQQMSETQDTIMIAEEYQREIIHHKCIFMFTEPVAGFHKFHRTLVKIFGGMPD